MLAVAHFSVFSPIATASHKANVGVIVGPVVAGVAAVSLVLAAFLFLRRRRARARRAQVYKEEPHLLDAFSQSSLSEPSPHESPNEAPGGPLSVYDPVVPRQGKRAVMRQNDASPNVAGNSRAEVAGQTDYSPRPLGYPPSSVAAGSDMETSGPRRDVGQIEETTSEKVEHRLDVDGIRGGDAPPRYQP